MPILCQSAPDCHIYAGMRLLLSYRTSGIFMHLFMPKMSQQTLQFLRRMNIMLEGQLMRRIAQRPVRDQPFRAALTLPRQRLSLPLEHP